MKKTFYQIMGLCGMLGMMAACNEDPELYTLDDQPDEMHITASTDRLMLDKGREDDIAIAFTWNATKSPINDTDPVSYSLRLYATQNKGANATDFYELDSDLSKSFTHDELNSIISTWVLPGEEVEVTAQVICTVHNEEKYVKPQSSKVAFTVSGYEKCPTYIYMVMTDVDGEVTTGQMRQRTVGSGIYEGTFDLVPCKYHFTTLAGKNYPAYGNEGDGTHLVYLNEGTPIVEFTNTITGRRTFVVDTNKAYNDCQMFNMVELPSPQRAYIIGDGCSVGWNMNSADGLFTVDARKPYIYTWTGQFNAGKEFKIGLGGGTYHADPFFFASEPNADPLTNHKLDMYRLQDVGYVNCDWKWVPSVSGNYTFTLYLETDNMYTEFVPAN